MLFPRPTVLRGKLFNSWRREMYLLISKLRSVIWKGWGRDEGYSPKFMLGKQTWKPLS